MAPLVAGLLANGLNLLANAALAKGKEWVEEKTGVKIDETKPIDPETAAKLKIAEMEHEEELLRIRQDDNKLDAYIQEMFLKDRQDARHRDVEIIKVTGKNMRGDILAYASIGALILCIFLLFVADVPRGSRDLLLVTLGALVAIVKDVYGFEFGSSKNSERNAQAVTDMLKNGNGAGR